MSVDIYFFRSLSPPEWGRHESCFEEFDVFDDDYDGPKGILTSRLPDGTSTLDYGNINYIIRKYLG